MTNLTQIETLQESFRVEATELLSELEIVLIDLEETPNDPELTNRAFRALHSIKGSGAMFGFDAMSEFVHQIENVFDKVRKGQIEVTQDLIDSTLQARDELLSMVGSSDPVTDAHPENTGKILAQFRDILSADRDTAPDPKPEAPEPEPTTGSESGSNPAQSGVTQKYHIRFVPPADILRRGTDPVMLIDQLRELGSCTVTADTTAIPALESLSPDDCYLSWLIDLETDRGIQAIQDVFVFVEDDGRVVIEPVDDQIQDEAKPADDSSAQDWAMDRRRNQTDRRQSRTSEQSQAESGVDTIRVPSARLDSLVDLVGELVTVQARLSDSVAGSGDPTLQAVSESVERLTDELRDTAMTLRMVPIGATFSKLRRLVRDLGKQLGKEVKLETEGDETELDKTVIERLGDPLIHLIRNCLDHGIETPAQRNERGKPAAGHVRLRAAHEGATVVVAVSDDGAGLDLPKIRKIAEQKGIITRDANLSDREIRNLIFAPGFSTASAVTEVSGRGVGMDVVRRTIDNLGGSIEIVSEEGEGTTITLQLPLTLAIIDGILVQIRDQRYVLPLSAVHEFIEISRASLNERDRRRLVDVRGSLLPYVDLGVLFEAAGSPPEIGQIVVVDWDGSRVGLLVDQVLGQQQTVIKKLGWLPQRVDGVSGATILGDGSVALILDVSKLIKVATDTEQNRHREAV